MANIHDIANKPLCDLLKQQWSVSYTSEKSKAEAKHLNMVILEDIFKFKTLRSNFGHAETINKNIVNPVK